MLTPFLKSKLHRAYITQADINYEGSITIGTKLLDASGMVPFEKVEIYNIHNGERFSTYVIKGSDDGAEICLNGAAARKAMPGDRVIICAYHLVDVKNEAVPDPVVIKIISESNTFKRG